MNQWMIPSVVFLVGCGYFAKTELRQQVEKNGTFGKTVIFEYGDPFQLIEGTTLNSDSPFDLAKLRLKQTYVYSGKSDFISREAVLLGRPDSQEEIESENQTTEKPTTEEPSYSFSPDGDYFVLTSEGEHSHRLVFSKVSETYALSSFDGKDVKVLHYSALDDLSAFTFLLDTSDETGRALRMLSFYRNGEVSKSEVKIDEKYVSIIGAGLPVKLPSPITVTVTEADRSLVGLALQRWVDNCIAASCSKGSLGATDFSLVTGTPLPFSDVHQNSVKIVDGFFEGDGPASTTLGFTFATVNPTNHQMYAANAIILRTTIDRRSRLIHTLRHEIGHLFGLGHQFARSPDTGKSLYPSVMGYEYYDIQEFDLDHIEKLYGAYPTRPALLQ